MVEVIVGILLGIIVLVMTISGTKEKNLQLKLSSPLYYSLILFLFAAFVFLLFWKVDEVPVPYHADEAGAIYDGLSIAKYHCDRWTVRFPVYFMNFGTHGSSALYGYSAALMFLLFGYSVVSARLPAIIFSIFSVLIFTMTIRRTKGRVASVLALAFFCILPFSIMHSRWGLDAYLLFPMLTISCSFFLYAVSSGKISWFIVSGILFGITLYSYSVTYILLPLLLGVNLIYLLLIQKIQWKQILAMGIPLFIFAFPLILMIAINNGFIPEIRTRFFSIPKLESYGVTDLRLKNIIANLSFSEYNIFYRIFVDDFLHYNVLPQFGTMYFISIPFVIYGFVLGIRNTLDSIKGKKYTLDFLMISLFCLVLCINLITEKTNVNRCCAIYIPLIYFLVIASKKILERRKFAAILAAGIYLFCFPSFLHYYFNDFEKDIIKSPLVGSIADLEDALLFAESVNQYDEMIYVLDPLQTYIYTLLIKDIDPFTFNRQVTFSSDGWVKIVGKYRFRLDADVLLPQCIYIFRDWEKMPENVDSYGFSTRQFGEFWVYYPEIAGTF